MISTLAEKYNLPEETVRQLINDGWLGCSIKKYEEILKEYQRSLAKGEKPSQAVTNAASVGKISERQVYNIINLFK